MGWILSTFLLFRRLASGMVKLLSVTDVVDVAWVTGMLLIFEG